MKKNNRVKKEVVKCSFCNKVINKKQYKLKDKFRSYVVCDKCNAKAIKYEAEYQKEAIRLNEELINKLEQLSNRLRKKYGLKKHK